MENTLEKGEYIKEHIIWGFISFLWGKPFFFICLPNCTYMESLLVLLLIGVCVMGLGIIFTWKRGRNTKNALQNIIVSWAVYVCILYFELYKKRIFQIGIICAVVSGLMTVLVLARKIKNQDRKKQIVDRRIRNVIFLWRRNITYASLIFLVPLGASLIIKGTIMNSEVKSVKTYGEEHGMDANMEEISCFVPEKWADLDLQQRLNVCQKIVNCEGFYYGFTHEVNVGTADLEEYVCGNYNSAIHQIIIDLDYLKDANSYEVLETLLHECAHAYQHEQVEVYQMVNENYRNLRMFDDIADYAEEFADYQNGSEDFAEYYFQKTEMEARSTGRDISEVYIREINRYLNGK